MKRSGLRRTGPFGYNVEGRVAGGQGEIQTLRSKPALIDAPDMRRRLSPSPAPARHGSFPSE